MEKLSSTFVNGVSRTKITETTVSAVNWMLEDITKIEMREPIIDDIGGGLCVVTQEPR